MGITATERDQLVSQIKTRLFHSVIGNFMRLSDAISTELSGSALLQDLYKAQFAPENRSNYNERHVWNTAGVLDSENFTVNATLHDDQQPSTDREFKLTVSDDTLSEDAKLVKAIYLEYLEVIGRRALLKESFNPEECNADDYSTRTEYLIAVGKAYVAHHIRHADADVKDDKALNINYGYLAALGNELGYSPRVTLYEIFSKVVTHYRESNTTDSKITEACSLLESLAGLRAQIDDWEAGIQRCAAMNMNHSVFLQGLIDAAKVALNELPRGSVWKQYQPQFLQALDNQVMLLRCLETCKVTALQEQEYRHGSALQDKWFHQVLAMDEAFSEYLQSRQTEADVQQDIELDEFEQCMREVFTEVKEIESLDALLLAHNAFVHPDSTVDPVEFYQWALHKVEASFKKLSDLKLRVNDDKPYFTIFKHTFAAVREVQRYCLQSLATHQVTSQDDHVRAVKRYYVEDTFSLRDLPEHSRDEMGGEFFRLGYAFGELELPFMLDYTKRVTDLENTVELFISSIPDSLLARYQPADIRKFIYDNAGVPGWVNTQISALGVVANQLDQENIFSVSLPEGYYSKLGFDENGLYVHHQLPLLYKATQPVVIGRMDIVDRLLMNSVMIKRSAEVQFADVSDDGFEKMPLDTVFSPAEGELESYGVRAANCYQCEKVEESRIQLPAAVTDYNAFQTEAPSSCDVALKAALADERYDYLERDERAGILKLINMLNQEGQLQSYAINGIDYIIKLVGVIPPLEVADEFSQKVRHLKRELCQRAAGIELVSMLKFVQQLLDKNIITIDNIDEFSAEKVLALSHRYVSVFDQHAIPALELDGDVTALRQFHFRDRRVVKSDAAVVSQETLPDIRENHAEINYADLARCLAGKDSVTIVIDGQRQILCTEDEMAGKGSTDEPAQRVVQQKLQSFYQSLPEAFREQNTFDQVAKWIQINKEETITTCLINYVRSQQMQTGDFSDAKMFHASARGGALEIGFDASRNCLYLSSQAGLYYGTQQERQAMTRSRAALPISYASQTVRYSVPLEDQHLGAALEYHAATSIGAEVLETIKPVFEGLGRGKLVAYSEEDNMKAMDHYRDPQVPRVNCLAEFEPKDRLAHLAEAMSHQEVGANAFKTLVEKAETTFKAKWKPCFLKNRLETLPFLLDVFPEIGGLSAAIDQYIADVRSAESTAVLEHQQNYIQTIIDSIKSQPNDFPADFIEKYIDQVQKDLNKEKRDEDSPSESRSRAASVTSGHSLTSVFSTHEDMSGARLRDVQRKVLMHGLWKNYHEVGMESMKSLADVEQEADNILDIMGKVKTVEKAMYQYLQTAHGEKISAFEQLVNDDGEYKEKTIDELRQLYDAYLNEEKQHRFRPKRKKVERAFLVLTLCRSIQEMHESGKLGVDDYQRAMADLRDVFDMNDEKTNVFQGNRFAECLLEQPPAGKRKQRKQQIDDRKQALLGDPNPTRGKPLWSMPAGQAIQRDVKKVLGICSEAEYWQAFNRGEKVDGDRYTKPITPFANIVMEQRVSAMHLRRKHTLRDIVENANTSFNNAGSIDHLDKAYQEVKEKMKGLDVDRISYAERQAVMSLLGVIYKVRRQCIPSFTRDEVLHLSEQVQHRRNRVAELVKKIYLSEADFGTVVDAIYNSAERQIDLMFTSNYFDQLSNVLRVEMYSDIKDLPALVQFINQKKLQFQNLDENDADALVLPEGFWQKIEDAGTAKARSILNGLKNAFKQQMSVHDESQAILQQLKDALELSTIQDCDVSDINHLCKEHQDELLSLARERFNAVLESKRQVFLEIVKALPTTLRDDEGKLKVTLNADLVAKLEAAFSSPDQEFDLPDNHPHQSVLMALHRDMSEKLADTVWSFEKDILKRLLNEQKNGLGKQQGFQAVLTSLQDDLPALTTPDCDIPAVHELCAEYQQKAIDNAKARVTAIIDKIVGQFLSLADIEEADSGELIKQLEQALNLPILELPDNCPHGFELTAFHQFMKKELSSAVDRFKDAIDRKLEGDAESDHGSDSEAGESRLPEDVLLSSVRAPVSPSRSPARDGSSPEARGSSSPAAVSVMSLFGFSARAVAETGARQRPGSAPPGPSLTLSTGED